MCEFRSSGELSDICVTVDKTEFHLHKFPLFLNSLFFRALCRCGMMDEHKVTLSQFPGGAKTFALIADYCYGLEIDIDSRNVVELRCAAEFLQMTSQGNLASHTTTALERILQPPSESSIVDIISSACLCGETAIQTDIIPLCFDALIRQMKRKMKGTLSEDISEALTKLPVEWFVGFVIRARDASVAVSGITSLVARYLEGMVRENRGSIQEHLQHGGLRREVDDTGGDDDVATAEDFGEIMDAILLELPEKASLSQALDSELLCLLFTLAQQLKCKCEGMLLAAICDNLGAIPREILVTMPTNSVVTIAERSVHNNDVPPTTLCNTVDKYLWERTKLKQITLEEFEAVFRAIPKAYRPQHDSVLLIAEELFSVTEMSEESKLKILEGIDTYQLHEETLRKVSERNVIPSSFLVRSALAVSSRLRNELTEAKAKLVEKDKAMRDLHAGVSDVVKGQWLYNDITLNVTPTDESNTRVQLAKVLPRETTTGLTMEHEVFDGKLTLCVRSSRENSTQTFLFDPFNEQLIQLTRSKHDNLMVGEHYAKKKHTTSYWPFTDVAS